MKSKIIIPLILIIFIAVCFFVFNFDKQDKNKIFTNDPTIQEKIKIAACPTCFELGKKIRFRKISSY
mgnify:CR=1 FL=1